MNFDNKDEIFAHAMTFHKMNNFDMCIKVLKKIHKYYPEESKVIYYIARTYLDKKEYKKAIKHYLKLITIHPSHIQAKFDLSHIYLLKRVLSKGFKWYESRIDFFEYKEVLSNKYPVNMSMLKNKRVFLYCEQGYGDSIQFIRYVKHIQKHTNNIDIFIPKPLYKLFKKNFENINFITNLNRVKIKYDYVFSMLSIPYLIKIDRFKPMKKYLNVKKNSLKRNNSFINIGLCWQGELKNKRDKFRSIDIDLLINQMIEMKLPNCNKLKFYSLQKDICVKHKMINDLGNDFKNFYDTAVAIKSMDIIITVDTVVCHLAGALGIKTYLLLPFYSDWRWGEKNKKSDLYKFINIIRQESYKSWEKPLSTVFSKLKKLKQ